MQTNECACMIKVIKRAFSFLADGALYVMGPMGLCMLWGRWGSVCDGADGALYVMEPMGLCM